MTYKSISGKPTFKYILEKVQSKLLKDDKAVEMMDEWVYLLIDTKVKQDIFLDNGVNDVLTYSQAQAVIGHAILKAKNNLCH